MATDYGTDFDGITDITPEGATVSGRLGLAQSVARRLVTPRGALRYDPNYGFDLRQFLKDGLKPSDLRRIAPQINAECVKDERVLSASATVSLIAGKLRVALVLRDAAGPFRLVLSISDVTVDILEAA